MSEDRELENLKRRMLERMTSPPSKSNILRDGVVNLLTDANFDQAVAGSRLLLLVDFWADWCIPCRSMAPMVEAMARDHSGRAYFAKINTDQNRVTQARFGVMSIPNFIFFKGGKQVDQVLGAVGRLGLEAVLSRYLS